MKTTTFENGSKNTKNATNTDSLLERIIHDSLNMCAWSEGECLGTICVYKGFEGDEWIDDDPDAYTLYIDKMHIYRLTKEEAWGLRDGEVYVDEGTIEGESVDGILLTITDSDTPEDIDWEDGFYHCGPYFIPN